MKLVYVVLKLLVGSVFGIGTALALSPALASFGVAAPEGGNAAPLTFAIIVLVAVLCAFAPTGRRAFGRGFLAVGVALFVLPLSTLLLSGAAFNEVVGAASEADQAAAAVGAGLAGGMLTAAASFIGFILGSVFLIVGLILSLGGRREVVVVDRRPG